MLEYIVPFLKIKECNFVCACVCACVLALEGYTNCFLALLAKIKKDTQTEIKLLCMEKKLNGLGIGLGENFIENIYCFYEF